MRPFLEGVANRLNIPVALTSGTDQDQVIDYSSYYGKI